MSFLAPLFLVGALAISLPIIFHLIRRTSREKVRFSSLMFLAPSPPRITRKSRLEHILLLALRCVVLCLLSMAFARPFFQRQMSSPPISEGGKRIIALLDTSASMRRENLWNEALARIEEIGRRLSASDAFALLAFDQTVVPLLSFDEWKDAEDRLPLLRQRLSALKPGWAAGHLDNALIHAAEEFEQQATTASAESSREIIVVSDFEEGTRLEGLQSYEWPKFIGVRLISVKAKRPTNAGISLVADREDAPSIAGQQVGPRLRITNSRESGKEQFEVRWVATAQGSDAATTLKAYVPAGQSRVFLTPPAPTNSRPTQLVLSGDEAAFDNQAFWSDPSPVTVDILFFGSDAPTDPNKLLYYLKRAFSEQSRQRVNLVSGGAVVAAMSKEAAYLAIASGEIDSTAASALREWIAQGRTALVVMDSVSSIQTIQNILGTGQIACEEADAKSYAMLGQIAFEHPLFSAFADPRYSDFTKIHFWKHRRLAPDAIPNSRVLAQFDDSSPALLEAPLGKGKLLVLTSGWQPSDSQLALSSKFVPLLYSILEYSGAPKPGSAQFIVGDTIPMASGGAASGWTIQKPDGNHVALASGLHFSGTDIPGIYTATSQQVTQQFAVNLAPSESKTAPLPFEELQRFGVSLQTQPAADAATVQKRQRQLQSFELENRQKLWRWLIIAVLVVLVVETWLAGTLTRRPAMVESRA